MKEIARITNKDMLYHVARRTWKQGNDLLSLRDRCNGDVDKSRRIFCRHHPNARTVDNLLIDEHCTYVHCHFELRAAVRWMMYHYRTGMRILCIEQNTLHVILDVLEDYAHPVVEGRISNNCIQKVIRESDIEVTENLEFPII